LSFAGRTLRILAARLPPVLVRPLGGPVAVFFHGVEQNIFDSDLQENHHAVEDFYEITSTLKVHFDVAPLSELGTALRHPQKHRRTVFLMSDDGYANTLHTAANVLEGFGLPWTLFVSTHHIDTAEPNPMFVARAFLRYAPDGRYAIPHLAEPIQLNGARQAVASQVIAGFRFLPAVLAREALNTMHSVLKRGGNDHHLARYTSERFLNWDEVRLLAGRGVTIGAHASWHWAMHSGESEQQLKQQAETPRRRIEAEVGLCRYFAYPFGNTRDIGAKAWQAVRDAGYEYAFTTLGSTLNARQNPWLLPRYGLEPCEPHLASLLPLLRLGGHRVARWQRTLA
jgi:peptidoglycan/xylan/chitin deacetylase (PgdA/CDA1 family)